MQDPWLENDSKVSELRERSKSCDLCRMIYQSLNRFGTKTQRSFKLFRDGSLEKVEKDGPPVLTICAEPGL
jgi:hypothetical protein